MTRKEALLGGPGLDGYAFCADTYCVECGQARILKAPQEYFADSRSLDSDHVPQPIFFGEHPDRAVHCADCSKYMYGEESDSEEC